MTPNRLIIVLLVLFSLQTFAQEQVRDFEDVKQQDDVEGFIWNEEKTYEDFNLEKLSAYPEDDAVILKRNLYLTTQQFGGKLRYWYMDRDVIFIRNQEAIEEFSTVSFSNNDVKEKFNDYAVRVFKKNGEVIELRKADYIEDSNELKVAIPNLEAGDIIDKYFFIRDNAPVLGFRILANDQIFFADNYPVLDHYCEFTLKRGSYFKFASLNDAPEIQIKKNDLPYGVLARVIIQDTDRAAYELDERWFNPFKEIPVIRYALAVGDAPDSYFKANFFSRHELVLTKTSSGMISESMKIRIRSDFHASGIKKRQIKDIKSRIESEGYATNREKVEEFYQQLLYTVHTEMGLGIYYEGTSFMMPYIAEYCREIGVRSRWNYVFPRFFGEEKDLFHPSEMFRLFEMDFEDGSEYLQFVSQAYPFGYYQSILEDSDCFYINNTPRADIGSWDIGNKKRLPVSSAQDNRLDIELYVTMDEDTLYGDLVYSQFGHESSGSVRPCDDEEFDCALLRKMLGGQHIVYNREGRSKYSLETLTELELPRSTSSNKEKFAKWMIMSADEELENLFGEDNIESIESMKILNTGLKNREEGFSYRVPFKIKNYVKKVGPNRIVDIGQLIGGQVEISQENRDRKSDVYFNFPRSNTSEIHFLIPEGHIVEGLEEMESSVDNALASFDSSARIEGDTLKISTVKVYKSNQVKVENWPLLLEVLDAAYNFSQKKILLKPEKSD